jgi:hypothetical protein
MAGRLACKDRLSKNHCVTAKDAGIADDFSMRSLVFLAVLVTDGGIESRAQRTEKGRHRVRLALLNLPHRGSFYLGEACRRCCRRRNGLIKAEAEVAFPDVDGAASGPSS